MSSGWPPDVTHPCQGLVCDHGIVRFSNTSPVSLSLNRQAEKKASTSAVTKHANARREEAAGMQSQYKGVTATNERGKNMVITLDKNKRPLGFMSERRCRILLEKKRAVLYRYFPTIVILKDVDARKLSGLSSYRIKIDPGAKYTGIAIVMDDTNEFMYAMQIEHRGEQIKKNLDTRRNARGDRRSRETGYRRPKWENRCAAKEQRQSYDSRRDENWLPPSIKSTADNIISWIRRLCRWINITNCSIESVRFDTQLMENPEIEGVEYQQGTLYGYEVKEYLLEKYGHTCQYCGGKSSDPILEWEHMIPRSRGGSDRLKNAALACHNCNQDKGNHTLEEWQTILQDRIPKERGKQKELNQIRQKFVQQVMEGKTPVKGLRYAAWVNSSRRYSQRHLYLRFPELECSSGGRTKYNRNVLKYPKEHHYDALCVGEIPEDGFVDRTNGYYLYAKATGRGTRLRGQINQCGVIIRKWMDRSKTAFGFQTGDLVVADVPKDTKYKYKGHFSGRVMIRKSGSFDIRTLSGELVTVNAKFCRLLQNNSGYQMMIKRAIPLGN